jgi:methionyl-tRNA formyltransferase
MISKGQKPTPQNSTEYTRAYKLTREEGRINWSLDAEKVSAHIRAFTSDPGAWTEFRGAKLRIETPRVSDISLPAGFLQVVEKELHVGTATQALKIGFITSPGKSRMDSKSWINGARIAEGDFFG